MPRQSKANNSGGTRRLELYAPVAGETAGPGVDDEHPEEAATDALASLDPSALVEALLFVGGPPVTPARLDEVLPEFPRETIVRSVAQLNQLYHRQGRPYEIRRAGTGYQMVLRPQFASVVRRARGQSRQVRLSQAAVEVLSLVAYKQPVTAQEVDAIRGTGSGAILRLLRRRNLIDVAGRSETGRAVQYGTTRRFLELFHLSNLEELPRVEELEKL